MHTKEELKQKIAELDAMLADSQFHLVHNIDTGDVMLVADGVFISSDSIDESKEEEIDTTDRDLIDYVCLDISSITDWQSLITYKK